MELIAMQFLFHLYECKIDIEKKTQHAVCV